MTGFVFLRVRAHRLLLVAALLSVLLTTCVLTTLTAFSGSMGDAALRHTLTHRSAASTTLTASGPVERERRAAADTAVHKRARAAFDGLPVTVRKLEVSGPYALPRTLQTPAERRGEPDLTAFAALDRSRVRLTAGSLPAVPAGRDGTVQVALPEAAAEILKLEPGARLTLTDRLGGPALRVLVTGLYEPTDRTDPYWQLDRLGGLGVREIVFTTYGPLLSDPAVFASGTVSSGTVSWLAAADFRQVTTGRMDALAAASASGPKALMADPVLKGQVAARTSLPALLERTEQALLVSRSTLLIVALQLALLAGYALLLVARMLSTERAGESEVLLARGGSRGRIISFAVIEALLLAVPAALLAPLLAGPLTRLLGERGSLARTGVRLDPSATGAVWLTAASVALACALAVVAPALTAGSGMRRRGRAAALPGFVRAGADIALLLVAGVAYWQLDRQTGGAGSGALSGDLDGDLGIDPLLVAAPALALLAGTVLTLRLLPPLARLAERRAAGGRGLPMALAAWQFARRPLRGAGPVLLLVLSVAMGMLAIGQSVSWDRSQSDQADFRTGASIRVVGGPDATAASADAYAVLPGVRAAAPAYRETTELSGGRTSQILALDTAHADEHMLMRADLADASPQELFDAVAPPRTERPGLVPATNSAHLLFDLRIGVPATTGPASPSGRSPRVTVLLEDRYGLAYRVAAGTVPVDGRAHPVRVAVSATAGFALTGVELEDEQPLDRAETHRVSLSAPRTLAADGRELPVPVPDGLRWHASMTVAEIPGGEHPGAAPRAVSRPGAFASFDYSTGSVPREEAGDGSPIRSDRLRIAAARAEAPALNGVATDSYLRAAGAKVGDNVDIALDGRTLSVKIVGSVRQLPTTGTGSSEELDAAAAVPGTMASAQSRAKDGGGLLLDLKAVADVMTRQPQAAPFASNEWWLSTDPGRSAEVAAALREPVLTEPVQVETRVLVRDETADELISDPLGAGPQSALLAVTAVTAALAAVGFAVSAAGSQRERAAEFAVLRALGAPRRRLARMIAAEQGVLIAVALLVGTVLGALLTRAVVPLIVLTGQATRPVPDVLVRLPAGQIAVLLAGVAALPLVIVAAIALHRPDPSVSLRHQGGDLT